MHLTQPPPPPPLGASAGGTGLSLMSMRLLSAWTGLPAPPAPPAPPPAPPEPPPIDPGSAVASFLNSALMLYPPRADVSMNSTPSSRALASPSSVETCLRGGGVEGEGGGGEMGRGKVR
jgi:hypothetical protein